MANTNLWKFLKPAPPAGFLFAIIENMDKPHLIVQKIPPGERKFTDYRKFVPAKDFAKIEDLAAKLSGKNIVYVNSTPAGGGVAELLKNLVPLLRSLGLSVQWSAFDDDEKFFAISKKLHNSLQGSNDSLTTDEKEYYLSNNRKLSEQLIALKPDLIMLQDPQPLGMAEFLPPECKLACRIHIDLTEPNADSLKFIQPMLDKCDMRIFTMREFAPKGLNERVMFSPPGIDPFSLKNEDLTQKQIQAVGESIGVDLNRPILSQVSRFDKWKDPEGVVQVYRLVKKDYPGTQLVLMGIIEAQDDPEALAVFENVKNYVGEDPDVFLIANRSQLTGMRIDTFVNAVQRFSDVVLQKSLREGFGLTVSEAMWKKRCVIGGNVGGIRLQIQNGVNGFLVDSIEDAAEVAIRLISDKNLSKSIGLAAHQTVEKNFLLTRYIQDELTAMRGLC